MSISEHLPPNGMRLWRTRSEAEEYRSDANRHSCLPASRSSPSTGRPPKADAVA